MIRWYVIINIKTIVCCFKSIAKHRANSLWQTGRRFMYTLVHSHALTRRGMTQCICASLLVLDRWEPSKHDCTQLNPQQRLWTLYTFSTDSGDLLEMYVAVPSSLSGAAQQRLTVTFGCCSIRCKGFVPHVVRISKYYFCASFKLCVVSLLQLWLLLKKSAAV